MKSIPPPSFLFVLMDCLASSLGYYYYYYFFFGYISGIFFPFLYSTNHYPKTCSHCLLFAWSSCLQTLLEPWFSKCGSLSNSMTIKPLSWLDMKPLKPHPDLLTPGAHSLFCCRACVQPHLMPPTLLLWKYACLSSVRLFCLWNVSWFWWFLPPLLQQVVKRLSMCHRKHE